MQLDRKHRDLLLRKTDILKAAERVFADKGYYEATMSDIAQEAQYGVGTIYIYFKDKQQLYISLFEEKMRGLIALVKEEVAHQDDVLEKIEALVRTELDFFNVNGNFFRILFSVRDNLESKVKDVVSSPVIKLMMQLLDYITDVVKEAQARAVIRSDYPPRKIAFVLQHLVRAVVIPRLLNEKEAKDDDAAGQSRFVMNVFLNGLGIRP